MMYKPRRMHPAVIIFKVIHLFSYREVIIPIIVSFISFSKDYFLYVFSGIALLLVIFTAFSIISWLRFTYVVTEDELQIEWGIFVRKKRYISKGRIQSIDLTVNVLHRIFKLARVQIETAGSGKEAEASLTAVKLTEAERLHKELKGYSKTAALRKQDVEAQVPFHQISNKRLFIAGTTSGSIGFLLAIIAFFFSEVEQFIPKHVYDDMLNWIISLSVFLLIIIISSILLILWLLGIAGTMIKFWNFRIERHENELFITRGLFEKKQTTIPLKRIQAIGMEESIFRQPFGYATIFAEVAGNVEDSGGAFVLYPLLKKKEVEELLSSLLPAYTLPKGQIQTLPNRALKYYLLRACVPMVLISIAILIFLPTFSWTALILLAVGIWFGYLRYRDAGFLLEKERIILTYRKWYKQTLIIFHKRIQTMGKQQHIIHRKQHLANIEASILGNYSLGSHYKIKDLEERDVDRIASWYSYRKRSSSKNVTKKYDCDV
ncbi:PH domain-containing protein [Virgibacillus proomii]|jgi:putative membrane protein|uniref:PH domain-containing protein n=1 Tax=Virgibacillus proomii TaxID=84407 RepID=UPI001FE59A61|nr:PH domain-containing protein [Virgibacillus proomii]